MLYVSLHIPKTGGITFRQLLKQRFGDRLQMAYDESEEWPIVQNPMCIHGHGVFKYFSDTINAHRKVKWITFLREPLSSAISMYFFAKRYPGARFTDRGLGVFLTNTEPPRWPDPPGYGQNRFKQWFDKRPMERYDFVGVTEQFDESLVLLDHQFQWPHLYYSRENVGDYQSPKIPESIVERFRELNADDYAFYDRASQCWTRRNDLMEIALRGIFLSFDHICVNIKANPESNVGIRPH